MKEFLVTGGPWGMSFILILGIIILTISIITALRRILRQKFSVLDERLMLSIKYLGGIAFLSGLFCQTLGLYLAYQAIVEAADVSPMLVMQGVFISFYTTFFGLGVFLVSLIIWYLLNFFSRHPGGGDDSVG
jgi:biopolymer transport protein ExbB/TolQ